AHAEHQEAVGGFKFGSGDNCFLNSTEIGVDNVLMSVPAGFEWVNADDGDRSIFSFIRHSEENKKNLLFVCNFTPMARDDYRVGVP
ncbi:alpha amylase C-terminal domain-containing protein, partial [Escherichia coli]|uniref:alpha amylase C-terminal domain-containing protein n=1 Tax=Escherichia coli TaxID=562 RepID=UPI0028DE0E33